MEFDADVHDDDKESIMKQRRRRIENLIIFLMMMLREHLKRYGYGWRKIEVWRWITALGVVCLIKNVKDVIEKRDLRPMMIFS